MTIFQLSLGDTAKHDPDLELRAEETNAARDSIRLLFLK